jgi:general L-amino acid transport system substrate-binding protein
LKTEIFVAFARILKYAAMCSIVAGAAGFSHQSLAQTSVNSPTLDAIKQRGQVVCGVDTGMPGYAFQDSAGTWQGLDVSLCRAVASAVLGDPTKVKFVGATSQVRFTLLKSNQIDLLVRDTTLTFVRNNQLALNEPVINFYTGEVFMVRKNLNVHHVNELNGATICVLTGTTLEHDIADYSRANNIKINTLLFDRPEQAFAAAEAGRCDGYTDDGGSTAAARSSMKVPSDWVILPEVISREPLGVYVREGDPVWANIVKWTHYAMLEGEVLGMTQANIDEMKAKATDPVARKFLGLEGGFGQMFGLDDAWSYRVIKQVGNYGEVYDKYFGPKALDLPRGLNNLWDHGGLQYPLPWQ